MKNVPILGGISNVGGAQGYQPISVLYADCDDPISGATKQAITLWAFTPEELAQIRRGGALQLSIVGGQPPILLQIVVPE